MKPRKLKHRIHIKRFGGRMLYAISRPFYGTGQRRRTPWLCGITLAFKAAEWDRFTIPMKHEV